MKLICKKSKQTYINKAKKECHYYNYYLIDDNGHSLQIKLAFPDKAEDRVKLDMMAIYEK